FRACAGTWPQHVVRAEDSYFSGSGCRTKAGVHGSRLSPYRSENGKCEAGMELDADSGGLANAAGLDQRRDRSGHQYGGPPGTAGTSAARLYRSGIALVSDSVSEPSGTRITWKGTLVRPIR